MIGATGALVGRDAELRTLERALAALDGGGSRAVGIVGEPGIGKSRLLAELASRAADRGHVVLAGRAAELEHDGCLAHDTADRLARIAAPTLVLAGEYDAILPPRFGGAVATAIPNARFELLPGEAHQPFQEVPEEFNALVDAFWRDVEAGG